MIKCSYIILIANNALTIPRLIKSLQQIQGNFIAEFIFIVKRSQDDSLSVLKDSITLLANSTIIDATNNYVTNAISTAVNFIKYADYIHFLYGFEALSTQLTKNLIQLTKETNNSVTISSSNRLWGLSKCKLIEKPVKQVLVDIDDYDSLLSGLLVKFELLKDVYVQNKFNDDSSLLLYLTLANLSNFNRLLANDSLELRKATSTKNLQEKHLMAVLYFIYNNLTQISQNKQFSYDLLYFLARYNNKLKDYLRFVFCKYFRLKPSIAQIVALYENQLANNVKKFAYTLEVQTWN